MVACGCTVVACGWVMTSVSGLQEHLLVHSRIKDHLEAPLLVHFLVVFFGACKMLTAFNCIYFPKKMAQIKTTLH